MSRRFLERVRSLIIHIPFLEDILCAYQVKTNYDHPLVTSEESMGTRFGIWLNNEKMSSQIPGCKG